MDMWISITSKKKKGTFRVERREGARYKQFRNSSEIIQRGDESEEAVVVIQFAAKPGGGRVKSREAAHSGRG